jgi:quinol monooxygenase YgiN
MRFSAQQFPQALELLLSAAGPIKAKPGCRTCRVGSDLADSSVIHYLEEWDSEEAFYHNVNSADFWRVLLAMDLCSGEPEVAVGDATVTLGMDAMRRIRHAPRTSPRQGDGSQGS